MHVHHGAERARGKEFAAAVAANDLIVTTYALAARDAADLRRIAWRRVVVDEAQAIKNAATRQATAIRSLPAGSPDRRHRHAGGEPARRPVVDLGVRQPRDAGRCNVIQEAVRRADRKAR